MEKHIEKFFEIKEIRTNAGTKVNLILLENDNGGNEKAYLGFCEELQPLVNGNINELEGGELLVIPGGTICIVYHNGRPVKAPGNWKKLIIKSLEFQNPIMAVIEENNPILIEDALAFADPT